MGAQHNPLLCRYRSLRYIQLVAMARRRHLGFRSPLLHHPQRRRGGRLARLPRQHHRFPAANARRLRPRLQQAIAAGLTSSGMRAFSSLFFCVLGVSAFKLFVATLERGGKHRCPQHPIPRGNFFATPSPPSPTVPAKLCAALRTTSPASISETRRARPRKSSRTWAICLTGGSLLRKASRPGTTPPPCHGTPK